MRGGGHQGHNQARQQEPAEKRKLTVMLRDYDTETSHCNGINHLVVAGGAPAGQTTLFTAGRDRLIKLWHADYEAMQSPSTSDKAVSLIADLDGHIDWVNQLVHIDSVNTLISCSNDTTIKLWRLKTLERYQRNNAKIRSANQGQQVYRQSAFSTLYDHSDYVRCIDYAAAGRLFSAADDGKIFQWDLHVEKIAQKYENFDQFGNI